MQIGTQMLNPDPTMAFLGRLTGKLSAKNLAVTTTEQAPRNAILVHPESFNQMVTDSDELVDLVTPPSETPIDIKTTGAICEKFILGGIGSLTEDEANYVSRLLDLGEDSLDKKMFDVADEISKLINLGIGKYKSAPAQVEQAADFISNGVEAAIPYEEGHCETCNPVPEAVYDAVKEFIEENEISGPGYVIPDFENDDDIPAEVITEALDRFEETTREYPAKTLPAALGRALVIEVARNLVYEDFITKLGNIVGFADAELGQPA